MAGLLRTYYSTASNLYAQIRQATDGKIWDGASFVTYNSANWSNYAVALTEDTSSGYYKAAFPGAITAALYDIAIFERAGGSPALVDAANGPVGEGTMRWDGTVELTLVSIAVGSIANNAITAASIATGAIDADALATDAAQEIADALLDRTDGVETAYTLRQALRLILSAVSAKLSGAASTTVHIRNVTDTKDRIVATVDSDGNRTAVVLDVS